MLGVFGLGLSELILLGLVCIGLPAALVAVVLFSSNAAGQ